MLTSLRTLCISSLLAFSSLAAKAQELPGAPVSTPTTTPNTPAVAPGEPLMMPSQLSGHFKEYLRQRYAADREARAVIHLYDRKQSGGALWLIFGGGFIAGISSQTGTKTSSSGTTTFTVTPAGYAFFALLFGAPGISKLTRFSNRRLYEALKEYDEQRALSPFVLKKLRPRDYQANY